MVPGIPLLALRRLFASLKANSRSARRRRCGRKDTGPAAEVLEERIMLSASDPLASVSDTLSFETAGQSMWGPDGPPIQDTGLLFEGVTWDASANPSLSGTVGGVEGDVQLDASTAGRVGVDFQAILDPGSVDATYGSDLRIEALRGEGDTFRITSEPIGDPTGRLMTRSPNIDVESNFVFDVAAGLRVHGEVSTPDLEITVPTVDFEEKCVDLGFLGRHCTEVPVFGTKTVTIEGASFPFDENLVSFDIDGTQQLLEVTNQQISVMGVDLATADPGENLSFNFDLAYSPTEGVDPSIVDENNPRQESKPHAEDPFDLGVSFSMGDITLDVPTLNLQQTTFNDVNGEAGLRTAGETDLARLDLDADFLASILFGLPPLGASAAVSAGPVDVFNFSYDLLDVDVGPQFSVSQDFEFVPEVSVHLDFNKPVTIGGQQVQQHSLPLGSSVDVTFDGVTPGETLDIATTYTLENDFRNTTELLVAPQAELFALKAAFGTFLGTLFDESLVGPESVVGPAATLATIFNQEFDLGGFNEVVGDVLHLDFNLPPKAENDTATTVEDQPVLIDVLDNDSDPNGDPLTIVSTIGASHGTVQIDNKGTADPGDDAILYTPHVGFDGTDSFTYTIDDGKGLTDTATVTVNVRNLVDLSGRVFDDLDNDGLFEPLDGEAGISGVSVRLFDQADGTLIATESTESDGTYLFDVNLGAGTYTIVESQATGFLDGDETAGSTDGGATTNGTANAALPADGDEISGITVGEPGTTGDGAGYDFAEIRPSSIRGLVWEDFDNDAGVDFGEFALGGVAIGLSGTDDRGNPVSRSHNTDGQGIFEFVDLRPGSYALAETQPDGFLDGKDVVGEVNGVLTGDNDGGLPALSTTNDRFTRVVLAAPGSGGRNYNFGERVDGGTLGSDQTAGIGFWRNRNGQALIESLNGSPDSTLLARYLSETFPRMYAMMGDADGDGTADDPMTNVEVAAFYKDLFNRNGRTASGRPPKLDAQVLATALATYVTKVSLVQLRFDAASSTGFVFTDVNGNGVYDLGEEERDDTLDDLAQAQGFSITAGGVGSSFVNAGESGEAFGVADEADAQMIDLLLATDSMAHSGVLYDLDADGILGMEEETLRVMANDIYSAINEAGRN